MKKKKKEKKKKGRKIFPDYAKYFSNVNTRFSSVQFSSVQFSLLLLYVHRDRTDY